MVLSCGISAYSVRLFHLVNHGWFKALLFLGSGVLIHNMFDEQDIRGMGRRLGFNGLVSAFILLGSASLIGIPFFAG